MTPFIMIICQEYHWYMNLYDERQMPFIRRRAAYWIRKWLEGRADLVELHLFRPALDNFNHRCKQLLASRNTGPDRLPYDR